jgi:hypothetical protein
MTNKKRRTSSWDPGYSFDRDLEDESEMIVPEKCQNDMGICGNCGEKSCKENCRLEAHE